MVNGAAAIAVPPHFDAALDLEHDQPSAGMKDHEVRLSLPCSIALALELEETARIDHQPVIGQAICEGLEHHFFGVLGPISGQDGNLVTMIYAGNPVLQLRENA